MTTETQDRFLQELFASQPLEVKANGFTEEVMSETSRIRQNRILMIVAAVLVVGLIALYFAGPLMALTVLLVNTLGAPLIVLEGWIGFVLAPINNMGAVLLVLARFMRMFWRYLSRIRFSS